MEAKAQIDFEAGSVREYIWPPCARKYNKFTVQ